MPTYLDWKMDKSVLLEVLEKEDKEGMNKIMNFLSRSSNGTINIEDFDIYPKFYNFIEQNIKNTEILKKYSGFIKDINSIEFNPGSVSMYVNDLMDEYLYYILDNAWKNNLLPKKTDKSFYVVVYNKLKSIDPISKKVRYDLVYNYTQYNKLFFDLYYVYIMIQQSSMIMHNNFKIGSSYFFCIDEQLTVNSKLNDIRDDIYKNFYSGDNPRNSKPLNLIDLCKLLVEGKLVDLDVLDMSHIIYSLLKKDIHGVLDVLGNATGWLNNEKFVKECKKKC